MVETPQNALARQRTSLPYRVEEQLLRSKTGVDEECEDALYIGSSFVAVIDGATSKTERRWDGKTGGRLAALTLKEAFAHLPVNVTAHEAVHLFTTAIRDVYKRYGVLERVQTNPVERAVACMVVVSFWRNEIWFVGDCQCLLDQELVRNEKEIDTITANARSMFLEAEIAQGKTVEELLQQDSGRMFILPLLERQMLFQNTPSAGQYGFSVIDGFEVPEEGIHIHPLPADIETIVLASDGYPFLKGTLAESESALQEILHEDPLLFRKYKSTKGVNKGSLSFDDRAYVRLRVNDESEMRSGSEREK